MKTAVQYFSLSMLLLAAQTVCADAPETPHSVTVNCDRGDSINRALSKLRAAQDFSVRMRVTGLCRESVTIDRDGVTLEGDRASIDGLGKDAVIIDGAQRVTLSGFTIRNGANGVVG